MQRWFKPVTIATCEAEIRRIVFQGQPRQEASPYLKKYPRKKNWWSVSSGRTLA
jgi:hypothetical protein